MFSMCLLSRSSRNLVLAKMLVGGIGADSVGAMGTIARTAKKCGDDAPKSPPQEFYVTFLKQ